MNLLMNRSGDILQVENDFSFLSGFENCWSPNLNGNCLVTITWKDNEIVFDLFLSGYDFFHQRPSFSYSQKGKINPSPSSNFPIRLFAVAEHYLSLTLAQRQRKYEPKVDIWWYKLAA